MLMVNMKIGTPPKCLKTVRGQNVLTFQEDNFDVKGSSLSPISTFHADSQRWRLERSVRQQHRHGSEILGRNFRTFERTSSATEDANVGEPKKSSILDNVRVMKHLGNSNLERKDVERKGKLSSTKKTLSRSQNDKQKVYLKMVLNRPRKEHFSTSNKCYIDEDYIRLNDELFASYLTEEEHHSRFTSTNLESEQIDHSSSAPSELRSGVMSGKCRLRRKYSEVDVKTTDKSLVKYGR